MRKEAYDLGPRRVTYRVEALRAGMEALAGHPIGENNLMLVKEDVDVVDALRVFVDKDGVSVDKSLCRRQNLPFAEMQVDVPALQQHPVLG